MGARKEDEITIKNKLTRIHVRYAEEGEDSLMMSVNF